MPTFSMAGLRNDIAGADDLKELKNYLFMLVENLEYTLNNLDTENLSSGYSDSTSYSKIYTAAEEAKQAAQQAQAVAVQIGKGAVQQDSVIQAINASGETAVIQSGRILASTASGELTLLAVDAVGGIVPCKIAVSGDSETGYTVSITTA